MWYLKAWIQVFQRFLNNFGEIDLFPPYEVTAGALNPGVRARSIPTSCRLTFPMLIGVTEPSVIEKKLTMNIVHVYIYMYDKTFVFTLMRVL